MSKKAIKKTQAPTEAQAPKARKGKKAKASPEAQATKTQAAEVSPAETPPAETPGAETPGAEIATTEAPTAKKPKRKKGTARQPREKKEGKMSALDAAAKVLYEAGKPLNCQEMIGQMAVAGYWTSPGGKTPASTLYSAILREMKVKKDQSRFRKAAKGQFEHTGVA